MLLFVVPTWDLRHHSSQCACLARRLSMMRTHSFQIWINKIAEINDPEHVQYKRVECAQLVSHFLAIFSSRNIPQPTLINDYSPHNSRIAERHTARRHSTELAFLFSFSTHSVQLIAILFKKPVSCFHLSFVWVQRCDFCCLILILIEFKSIELKTSPCIWNARDINRILNELKLFRFCMATKCDFWLSVRSSVVAIISVPTAQCQTPLISITTN